MKDDQIQRIIKIGNEKGYRSFNIDCDPERLGHKSYGWTITAKSPDNNVTVLIAKSTSWAQCYKDAMEYLS